jgi:hypothetical protein
VFSASAKMRRNETIIMFWVFSPYTHPFLMSRKNVSEVKNSTKIRQECFFPCPHFPIACMRTGGTQLYPAWERHENLIDWDLAA